MRASFPRLRPLAAAFAALLALAAPAAAQQEAPALRLFSLGAGEVTGGYYAAASAICDATNRLERGAIRCSPEATPGSRYNIEALRSGQIDFAMLQSDWQRFAYEGSIAFTRQGPMANLRSLFSLYPEELTILARRGAGVAGVQDLAGRRIDVGLPASGRRGTALALLAEVGLTAEDFAAMAELPTNAALQALCQDRIDATLLVTGHPNAAVARGIRDCGLEIVPLEPGLIDRLLAASPDYLRRTIPAGLYPPLDRPVETFAVMATMVTRDDVPADVVEKVVADTLAELPVLKVTVPTLRDMRPAAMRKDGLTAPLNPGAAAAFDRAAP